jgi:hypothetical protein
MHLIALGRALNDGGERRLAGAGADIRVVRRNNGDDSIGGFDAGEDKIRLLGFGFDSFCDLTVVTNGANTVIDLATDTSVTLLDAAPDQLSPDDFLFA